MAVDTIPAMFIRAVVEYEKSDAFMYKDRDRYLPVSHRELFSKVFALKDALEKLGLEKGDRVALLSENRLEWVIADLAILCAGCINVPIYTTLTPSQIEFILRDSGAVAVFVSNPIHLEKVLSRRASLERLRYIFLFDGPVPEGDVLAMDRLIEEGDGSGRPEALAEATASIGPSDHASIIYTSGTTGEPKGAILTHGNFTSNVLACASIIDIGPEDTCLSFLPLSHSFERTAGYYTMLHCGVTIAYAESIDTVPQNLLEVRPTVMVSVPRLYEKMYARIMERATSGSAVKKRLFFWALGTGRKYVEAKLAGEVPSLLAARYRLAEKLVFSKLKERTGGRLRFFVSGGAPLAREIAEFFYAAGIPILEGYGLTETSPVVSVNTFEHFEFGTVGRAIPGVEVKTGDDGEILVRGPNVMQGYYNNPEATSAALAGGWFHTGDIGEIDSEGFIKITDRKKDLIVTAGGKNVAPQPIENRLKTSKYIAQAVLIGDRRKFISALIVPNFENLLRYAKAAGIPFTDMASLLANPRVREKIELEIERKSGDLARYEKIKKFILLEKDFSMEEEELTPTLKVRRAVVEKKFKEQIDALYLEEDREGGMESENRR